MANSDDISIIIGVQAQSVDVAAKKFEGMKKSVVSLNKMLNKGTISNAQYEKGLKELARANDVVLGSRQKSTSVIRRMARETEAMIAVDKRAGIAVKKVGKEVDRLSSKMDRASTSAKRLGKNMALTGKRTNRLGANMQQVGYQVGDFAVQIQGGTNAAVALGQQGAQLLGIFGPVGALAGAGLAIGTAIVAPLMRGKEEAANLVDRIKDLKGELAELKGLSISPELQAAFREKGDTDESILKKELQIVALKKDIETRGKDAKKGSVTLSERLVTAELQLTKLIGKREDSQAVINSFNKVSIKLSKQRTEDQIRLMKNQVALSEEEARSGTKSRKYRAEVIRQELETLAIESLRSQLHEADIKILLKNKSAVLEAEFRTLDILEAQRQKAADKADAEAKAAKDKAAKEKAQAEYMKRYSAALRGYAIAQGRLDAKTAEEKLAATFKYQNLIYTQMANSQAEGDKLAKSALEAYESGVDLSTLDVGKGVSAAALAAGQLAKNLNISVNEALRMIKFGQAGGGRGSIQPDAIDIAGMRSGGIILPSYDDDDKGGGGTNPREELAKYLEGKRQERDLETQLVGILGTEREIQTELFNTNNQYSDVITGKQEKELEGILRLTQAERDRQAVIEEAAAQQEQLGDFIGNSMETAMMGIVDGTVSVKDAFKSMAAEIIKELYRVLVVQTMVAAAKLALGFADGGVVTSSPRPPVRPQADGGVFTKVNAYANGGIVSSPTNFPMAGNQVGLMGEAGPEAIMPLKRGANGKLGVQMEGGGEGNMTVVQNFNFQANGDDSVKKLIAQAAPQIANMTKKSMLDDRRRGGQMKATFG